MRPKEDNQGQDQINPTLTWTPTFLGMEIRIPKSIHLGASQSIYAGELPPLKRLSLNHSIRGILRPETEPFTSLMRISHHWRLSNTMLSGIRSYRPRFIGNQALKSPDSNSDQIETLPVASITASSRINNNSNNNNNSDPPNLLPNVLDGNFETSWSNKERGSWPLFDLGTTKTIQSVAIAWYLGDSYDYYYSISVSNDGIIFTAEVITLGHFNNTYSRRGIGRGISKLQLMETTWMIWLE